MTQRKNGYYYYFVEGNDDRKVVNTLKSDFRIIVSGKIQKFNVVEEKLTKGHVRTLKNGTSVILVFDIDTEKVDVLKENITFLLKQSNIKDVICVTQVMNLEEELVRSCSIKEIKELTKSKSNKDFKGDVLRISNLKGRLEACGFDFAKFWNSRPVNAYKDIENSAHKIKI